MACTWVPPQLVLLHSKQMLAPGSMRSLVVVANYLIDSVPCDAFRVCNGHLYEGLIQHSEGGPPGRGATNTGALATPDACATPAADGGSADGESEFHMRFVWQHLCCGREVGSGAACTAPTPVQRYKGDLACLNDYLENMRRRVGWSSPAEGGGAPCDHGPATACRSFLVHAAMLRYLWFLYTRYVAPRDDATGGVGAGTAGTGVATGHDGGSCGTFMLLVCDKVRRACTFVLSAQFAPKLTHAVPWQGHRFHEMMHPANTDAKEPCVCARSQRCGYRKQSQALTAQRHTQVHCPTRLCVRHRELGCAGVVFRDGAAPWHLVHALAAPSKQLRPDVCFRGARQETERVVS